ncbi:hypothetical protein KRMM14A1004_00890 [Krasilnikovia sp. MM14-A1004]
MGLTRKSHRPKPPDRTTQLRPGSEEVSQVRLVTHVNVSPRVDQVRVEQHWWNGDNRLARRDVYVRTDGETWEVEAQMGGPSGKSKVQQCPGRASALILADAWRGPRWKWRQL